MAANKSFRGTGWAFPVSFHKEANGYCGADMVSEITDIEQSLTILLNTRPGERVMRLDYGGNLEDLLFEPANTSLISYAKDQISRAIRYYEARVELRNIEILEDENLLEGRVMILLDIIVRSTNARFNYVYDFYKREATITPQ